MVEGVSNISSGIIGIYNRIFLDLPSWAQSFLNIILLVILIILFCIFVWKIYTIMSRKNIFEFNLSQYNKASHPILEKFLGAILYFVEYIVIFPVFVFFWFAAFTIFLVLLTEGLEVQTILMISATVIMAIRGTAYYRTALSKDLAKLLPFTLLGIALTKQGFFNFEEILVRFTQLPLFFENILTYLIIIIVFEVILRIFDLLFSFFNINDEVETEE